MHAKSLQEMDKYGEQKGEFPESLHMYNLGIKDRQLQDTTMKTVKYLETMKDQINKIVQSTA